MRSDLGDWIRRRLKKGIADQGTDAQNIVDACGIEVPELREQWSHQRSTQLSIRARKFRMLLFLFKFLITFHL